MVMVIGLVKLLLLVFMCECAVNHQWLTIAGIWVMLMFTIVFEAMLKEDED